MRINHNCKIELAVSNDITRSNIASGAFLDTTCSRLIATDGHMLAVVPVSIDANDEQGYITSDALKTARKVCKDATIRIDANGSQVILTQGIKGEYAPNSPIIAATLPRPAGHDKFPLVDQIIPNYSDKPDEPPHFRISLNANLLATLAKAIGSEKGIVRLTFAKARDPIKVEGGADGAYGVLMPARA